MESPTRVWVRQFSNNVKASSKVFQLTLEAKLNPNNSRKGKGINK